MSKAAMIRARVELELKQEAESVLNRLGLSASDAIRLFYRQVVLQQGLPFQVVITNLEALEEIRNKSNLKGARNADDLFEQAGVAKRGKT